MSRVRSPIPTALVEAYIDEVAANRPKLRKRLGRIHERFERGVSMWKLPRLLPLATNLKDALDEERWANALYWARKLDEAMS